MAAAIRYFSLFLPTTRDIPAEKSWKLWLPMFSDFWQTWGSSPVWEVDLLRLYSRLAFHRVGEPGLLGPVVRVGILLLERLGTEPGAR